MRNTLEMNGMMEEAEEQISDLEDRVRESNPDEQNKRKKELHKMRIDLENSVSPSNIITYRL